MSHKDWASLFMDVLSKKWRTGLCNYPQLAIWCRLGFRILRAKTRSFGLFSYGWYRSWERPGLSRLDGRRSEETPRFALSIGKSASSIVRTAALSQEKVKFWKCALENTRWLDRFLDWPNQRLHKLHFSTKELSLELKNQEVTPTRRTSAVVPIDLPPLFLILANNLRTEFLSQLCRIWKDFGETRTQFCRTQFTQ